MAAIKYKNNNNNGGGKNNSTFKRSPSINSTVSLFDPHFEDGFKRSPSTHSSLSLSANTPTGRMVFPFPLRKNVPQLNSPSSFSECDARLSAFSPEPLMRVLPGPHSGPGGLCYGEAPRIPPVISENEAYQDGGDFYGTFNNNINNNNNNNHFNRRGKLQRPSSLCDAKQILPNQSEGLSTQSRPVNRLQRPTTLFKSNMQQQQQQKQQQQQQPQSLTSSFQNFNNNNNMGPMYMCNNTSTIFTPTGDPNRRVLYYNPKAVVEPRRFDSLSELGTPTSMSSASETTSPQFAAQIRPNNLGRRTSYRTYQKVAIPVAAPMSPIGTASECSFDMKSTPSSLCTSPRAGIYPPSPDQSSDSVPQSSACNPRIPVFETFKAYESLKSQMSTSSQGSTASKISYSDVSTSDVSSLSAPLRPIGETATLGRSLPDKGVPDTEDPELIKKLSFVSPKSGVFRPVAEGRRHKQSCAIM